MRLKQWAGHWLNCIGGDLISNSRLSDCSVGISIIVWLLSGSAEPQDGSSAHRPKEWIPHVFSWIWETGSSTLVVEKLASYNQLVISCFLISILFLDFIDGVSTRSRGGKGIVDDGKGRKKFLISGYMTEITCVVHYRTYKKWPLGEILSGHYFLLWDYFREMSTSFSASSVWILSSRSNQPKAR